LELQRGRKVEYFTKKVFCFRKEKEGGALMEVDLEKEVEKSNKRKTESRGRS